MNTDTRIQHGITEEKLVRQLTSSHDLANIEHGCDTVTFLSLSAGWLYIVNKLKGKKKNMLWYTAG